MKKIMARLANEHDIAQVPGCNAELVRLCIHTSKSMALTFFDGDEIIAIAGIIAAEKIQMGECFMAPAPGFFTHIWAALTMKRYLEEVEKKLGLIRYQITVKADEPKHVRFAEWLGYTREGRLRAYANGTDYFMYARVNECLRQHG